MGSNNWHKVLHLSPSKARCPLNIEEYYDIDKKVGKPGFKTFDGRFNWHCSCVASYVTDPSSDSNAKLTFKQCYAELADCMKRFPTYYRPILEQFNESLSDVFDEQVGFNK
ncbi:hypothetical protein TcWFU_002245 [Taenia crassiceps]|uniref:Uncharacterized protein n=1 Tax=Taenia crassiceps TaxID=6207 RepID=A0ABR4QPI7_9CEST